MTCHDHGAFVGPCSPEKHAMLAVPLKRRYAVSMDKQGKAVYEVREEPWEESMARAIEFAVFVDGVALCACCRAPLCEAALDAGDAL